MVLTYLVLVVCWILSALNALSLFAPALPSVFFCVSGGIAIGGAQSGNKCLVVATIKMSSIIALCVLTVLIYLSFIVLESLCFGLTLRGGSKQGGPCYRSSYC